MNTNSESTTYPRLLGDIGGTNARLAWARAAGEPLSDIANYRCADHASLGAAISRYLQDHRKQAPRACALGIANPITGDEVRMTNHHWSFSISKLKDELDVARLAVVNDFTALALSLPALGVADLHQLGGGGGVEDEPLAVLGAGTGLGVSGLLRLPGGASKAVAGEGGHASLAAISDEEAAVIARLRLRFGHVSAERVLSGPGLVNLYGALCAIEGLTIADPTPAQVIERAHAGSDSIAQRAVLMFCSFLGSVAGNLALTLGARGGVYIGGGIAPRLISVLETSLFRSRFEDKGRFRDYLAPIPVFVIRADVSPALVGASRALDLEAAEQG